MTQDNKGLTPREMEHILERLRGSLERDAPPRDEMLEIEVTLRGMLPQLEIRMEARLSRRPGDAGEEEAVHSLMHFSATLMWIQLHAYVPDGTLRDRLHQAVTSADGVARFLGG